MLRIKIYYFNLSLQIHNFGNMRYLLLFTCIVCVLSQTPACTFSLPSTCNSTGCPVTIPKNSFISFHYLCDICNASIQVASRSTDLIQVFSPSYLIPRLYQPLTAQQANTYVPFPQFTNLSTTCSRTLNSQVYTSGQGVYFYIYCKNTNVDCVVWYQIDVTVIQLNCAPNCPYDQLFSSKCNIYCYVGNCLFQNGACDFNECAPGCALNMLGNGVCDSVCNTQLCAYDNGACTVRTSSSNTANGQSSTTNSQQTTNAAKTLKLFV